MNKSITIIGRISSGKSTLANSIHDMLPLSQIISFGSYLKSYCEMQKWDFDRNFLQNLGQQFIDENPDEFLKQVVDFWNPKKNEILIFEGIRHKSIFEAVNKHYPSIASIYLDLNAKDRYERYKNRNKEIDKAISNDDFFVLDNHKVELEIEGLKSNCSLVFNAGSISQNLSLVENHIFL